MLELPTIALENQEIPIADDVVWEREKGEILQPERIGKTELERLQKELGTANFQAQYQQSPVPPSGNLVKLSWFRRYDEAPSLDAFEAVVQSWYTAIVPGEGNDWTVCTTWGVLGPRLYLLEVFRERLNYPDLRKAAIKLIRRYAPELVIIEASASGRSLCQDLSGSGFEGIRYTTPRNSKVERLAHQSAKIEAGLVYLPKEAPWLTQFESEIAAFPNGRHDDQVDSVSQFLFALDRSPTEIRTISYFAKS